MGIRAENNLRELTKISEDRIAEVNALLTDPDNQVVGRLLEIVEKYGGPEEINRKAAEASRFDNLISRLKEGKSPYLGGVEWLAEQRDNGAFISMADYYDGVLSDEAEATKINQANAVTLEISALQFFPWLIAEARQAIEKRELMPGRFIRVRNMKEQTRDNGDILATAAAMQVVGASYVETLDTRGTDGSNIHLGGPETITGYFGGVGEPNDYPFKWVEEYLHYYTTYGIRQVLNINAGTVLAAYLLHKLGVDNEFKISVYLGNDNPLAILWTLMTARLFAREDGTTSLIGFNLSNSVNTWTIRRAAEIRRALGLEKVVRLELHITETQKSIVRQPYDRREELVEVAQEVSNIAGKHEGGDPEVDSTREHPSDILDYFITKEEILAQGIMDAMLRNYLDKHDALNHTAEALVKAGVGVICAWNLHN
jgi:bifunctional DNA-binding transcriptional regulator/antitoxin component of YhaV-PrlF toxin-antitoxin module